MQSELYFVRSDGVIYEDFELRISDDGGYLYNPNDPYVDAFAWCPDMEL